MDRVETAKVFDRKQRGGIKQRIVDAHELKTVDELPCTADCGRPVPPDRPHHLDSRERAGAPPSPPPHERSERSGLRLTHDELHQRRRIEVGPALQRSSLRIAASSTLGSGTPLRGSSGAPSSSGSPAAGEISPVASSASTRLERGIGTSRATGRPRSVTSIAPPRSTSRRYRLACCRSSRTPMLFKCYS